MAAAFPIAAPRRRRRHPGLTAMIDVVFLLLVFFMLASRFGTDAAIPLLGAGPGSGAVWSGPPRLLEAGPHGALRLNGAPIAPGALGPALAALAGPGPAGRLVVLRPAAGATVQDMADAAAALRAAGFPRIAAAE